jgi:hypothetical protein
MESNLTHVAERPLRVGIFTTVEQADRAVAGLLAAGFTKDHISVVCSDRVKEKHFSEFEHQDPAGAHTPLAAATGSAIGALVGGLATAAAIAATGGLGIFIAGPLMAGSAGAGAVVGGLVGAMTTRGIEKELANYYDQAVTKGKILVAAEAHREREADMLKRAEVILREAGSEPVKLAEG